MLSEREKQNIKESFEWMMPRAADIVQSFYNRLFERAPEVRPLFKSSIVTQSTKLASTIAIAVYALDEPASLQRRLETLGARHKGWGAEEAHYGAVKSVLLESLADELADQWTKDHHTSWEKLLEFVASTMIAGARQSTPQMA